MKKHLWVLPVLVMLGIMPANGNAQMSESVDKIPAKTTQVRYRGMHTVATAEKGEVDNRGYKKHNKKMDKESCEEPCKKKKDKSDCKHKKKHKKRGEKMSLAA